MKIILYGLATCSRCKTAKTMLEKRNIEFEYRETTKEDLFEPLDFPVMFFNGMRYQGKEVLLEIRKLGGVK